MTDLALPFPPVMLVRGAVAAVWLYEGLCSKLLGGQQHQVDVVTSVPVLGPLIGRHFLKLLGVVEVLLAIWILSGWLPGWCAAVQVALLVTLNVNGLMWARHLIHDPPGMVLKNFALLVLAWVGGAAR